MLDIEEKPEVIVQESVFAAACGLEIVYSPSAGIKLCSASVNRPGLKLAGYGDYFANDRVQVLGVHEMTYLHTLAADVRTARLEDLFISKIPCLIVTRNQPVFDEMVQFAKKYRTPLFAAKRITANVISDLFNYLSEILADTMTVHSSLIDVHGIGVLITGDSGIGKSETSLELIQRGHRFVSDDVVTLKEIKAHLYGSSPEITQHMMEIRGIGIIDVKAMYGVGAVLKSKRVQMNVQLERWDNNKVYNRVGNVRYTANYLGIKIPKYIIPVEPGRNLAILIEVAVKDFRLKEEGYNTLEELDRRME